MAILQLARNAMATRFEIVLAGGDPVALRAAGEEALDEIERLEAQLSLFRPSSEIGRINARAAREPVRVTPAVFGLLRQAKELTEQTAGAFDVTIAPLVRCWGFMGGTGHVPRPEELEAARACVGMNLVCLDPTELTVRFERPGVMIDLGAIGKGYAIDRAVELLREAGAENALIHGGTSTIYGLGSGPEQEGWKVAITGPDQVAVPNADALSGLPIHRGDDDGVKRAVLNYPPVGDTTAFATVLLRDESLSVSAVWGKYFERLGKHFGHIIDPRTGEPASRSVLSAIVLPSATETDALSTALLTLGPAGHDLIANLRPGIKTLVAFPSEGGFEIKSTGIIPAESAA